jgi:hypothetical protein
MALIPGTLPTGTKYPNEPQSLLDTFASYLTAPEIKKNRPIVTTYVPAGGAAVNFTNSSVDENMFLNISGTITNLQIGFPSDGNSIVGQVLRVLPRSAVSGTVTYSAAGLTFYGSGLLPAGSNALSAAAQPTSFVAGQPIAWMKVAASTWFRIQ